MSVEFIDGQIVTEFVNDSEAFEKWANEKFKALDGDGDGLLSRDELQKRPGKLSSTQFELQSSEEIASLYDALFEKFDVDRSGTIDPQEFMALAKEIMLAKARGIGDSPVCIILQGDSLLMRAVQRCNS
ncbi:hypothetical protein C2S52_004713 [Perilla frutescens var. hirtella]|uniref:EF-hand domain-containing protein n=1 Tax=Perilla frutescens var. hirtella TaxID=608512 RepID=A0AAD4NYR9_PERFH|nr:hypothetical protein C2S52_004713 [Perilla frutescens var. hirtella]KAH6820149.1 hypothetical protein C2S53_017450 [Perilla frutescens var. hirtella]